MSQSLENFRPKLRSGRVIPQGSRIVFETDNPYNQIVLPMALADMVLLCSGHFSVREIVEKIYKKQKSVPFKSILQAIRLLHQGGFFENGQDLELNSQLRSWMEPPSSRWSWSWRFGQRILADRKSPAAFYFITLFLLIGSLFGMQSFPISPIDTINQWAQDESLFGLLLGLFVCSSLVQTARYTVRGIQLLLLTGKAYNVSLRVSPWGVHLHIGDEANELFENRLYTSMFHVSQILIGWFCVFCVSPVLPIEWMQPLLVVTTAMTFWETNPFVNSEGLRLIQTLMLPHDRDILAWHFEAGSRFRSIGSKSLQEDEDFARVCSVWGSFWLGMCLFLQIQIAVEFGPSGLHRLATGSLESALHVVGVILWFGSVYAVVEAFMEKIVNSMIRPKLRKIRIGIKNIVRGSRIKIPAPEILDRIRDLPLFSHFHDSNLLSIISHSELLDFNEGEVVFHIGEMSREIYVLLEGSVLMTRPSSDGVDAWTTELSGPTIFGEGSLLEEIARPSAVRAKSQCLILKVSVVGIRKIAKEFQVIRQVDDFRNAILVNQFFNSSPVFRSLSQQSVEFLSSRGTIEYFDQHQTIFRQGDPGDSIYLILRGSVVVEIFGNQVKKLNQGSFFGEIALIANIPRTASIHTLEPCVVFKLSADAFWEVLVQNIDLGVFIESVSETRLREDLELTPLLKPTGSDS